MPHSVLHGDACGALVVYYLRGIASKIPNNTPGRMSFRRGLLQVGRQGGGEVQTTPQSPSEVRRARQRLAEVIKPHAVGFLTTPELVLDGYNYGNDWHTFCTCILIVMLMLID